MNHKIKFGTDGWRGIIADDFTFANIRIVSQAIAKYIIGVGQTHKGIVIGFDNRFLSDSFAKAIADIMNANGIMVYMTNEVTPTPIIAYAVHHYQAAGAVMVTASHNPPEYNGMKFIPDYAGPAFSHITDRIVSLIGDIKGRKKIDYLYSDKDSAVELINCSPKKVYIEHINNIIDESVFDNNTLSIVVDPMFGAGIHVLDEILKKYNCTVYSINNYRDPLFGGSMPEPTEDNIDSLKKKMKEVDADLGFALDGDADRLAVIDKNGQFITPNQIIYMLMNYLIKSRKFNGTVARTVATTHMIDRIAERYHIKVDETPVGFKYICKSMLEQDSFIGGEESGGVSIKGHVPEKDGILASLLVVEMVLATGKYPSEIIAELQEEYGQVYSNRLDMHCSDDQKEEILYLLGKFNPDQVANKRVIKRNAIDGIKLILEDSSWVLIRPSGTESLFRIYAEGADEKSVKEIQLEICQLLKL